MSDRSSSDKRRRNSLYRYIGFICKDAGLTREDKLSLAHELFDGIEDVESYSELSTETLEDILFALKAWRVIQRIRHANGHVAVEAKVVIARLDEKAIDAATRQDETGEWQ